VRSNRWFERAATDQSVSLRRASAHVQPLQLGFVHRSNAVRWSGLSVRVRSYHHK